MAAEANPARFRVAGRSRCGYTRLIRISVAGLATLALGLGIALPAQAKPRDPTPSASDVARAQDAARTAATDVGLMQARLVNAQGQLEALESAEERAVEAYNGALFLLAQAEEAAAAARSRADAASVDLLAAQREVGRFAAASYRMGGDLGSFASMLDADGPTDLMNQASDLANVASSNDVALDRVAAARIVSAVLEQQATAAVEAQTAAAEQVRLAKEEAQARVADQSAQISGLRQLSSQLSSRLAQARATAGSLSQERRQGLAQAARDKAARERAAREAKQKAEAAGSSGNGNTAGPPPGDSDGEGNPSHWSPSFIGGTQSGNKAEAQKAIAYARKQLGKPYLWAAAGPDRFDCSGLTMMAWRKGGVSLPHWSVAQFAQARKVPAATARPGDLVFFAFDVSDPGTIHHVALYIGGGQMIHAPRTGDVVRVAAVSSVGGLIGFARP